MLLDKLEQTVKFNNSQENWEPICEYQQNPTQAPALTASNKSTDLSREIHVFDQIPSDSTIPNKIYLNPRNPISTLKHKLYKIKKKET